MKYFGYGAMSSEEVMEAVIGRRPTGTAGSVAGMRLCIQRIDQVPASAQEVLRVEWPDSFRSYVTVPDPEAKVAGMVWEVTEDERAIIRDWELVDLGWFDVIDVTVREDNGSSVSASTEILPAGQDYDAEVSGEGYPILLNPREEVLRVAEKSRLEFLAKR